MMNLTRPKMPPNVIKITVAYIKMPLGIIFGVLGDDFVL